MGIKKDKVLFFIEFKILKVVSAAEEAITEAILTINIQEPESHHLGNCIELKIKGKLGVNRQRKKMTMVAEEKNGAEMMRRIAFLVREQLTKVR